jgi:LPS-assembly protein
MRFSAARLAALSLLALGAPAALAQASAAGDRGPTTIEAERIEGVSDIEVSARGAVELRRDDVTVFGERLRYNRELGRIEAEGGVRLERGADRFFGPSLRYDTRSDTGVFEEPTFILNREQTARGRAERLEFLGRDRLRLTRGSYTSCEPGREDWRIEAGELELDYEAEQARARDTRLEFLGTTLFALPYASFPLEKRRKSGFLAPYYSQSTRRGLEVGVSYYWNIAPEYDLTLTPVHMSKRGEQLRSHFRYLGAGYSGELRHEYLFDDRELNRARTGLSLVHEHRFREGFDARLDLNKVSDDRYFADLRSHVRNLSLANLQREGIVNYSTSLGGVPVGMQFRIQRFQTLQDPLAPIVEPYDRLPQVQVSATRTDLGGLFDLAVPGEYVRFAHRTLVEGSRLAFNPTLAAPMLAPGYFLTPKLGLRAVSYNLSRTAPTQPDRPSLSIPWLSVDAGLVFEREARLAGRTLTQTLEPRLYYVYVPYRAQDQIPLFDTALADFNYANLFTENRFSGGDRFGDANQVTLAATSRVLDARGEELARATIGQRYYFKNERVGLTATAPLRSVDSSDLIASVGGRLWRDWSFDGTMQYSPRESRAERYGVSLRYSPEIAKVVNATYRFNRDLLRQVDLSGQWPVQPGWYAIGRVNYSFRDKRLLEGLGGIEYNAGCWVFRAVFSRVQAATQISSTTLLFQLELNGLGQIGSDDTVAYLKRQVPGYAVTNPANASLVPPSARPRLPFEQAF